MIKSLIIITIVLIIALSIGLAALTLYPKPNPKNSSPQTIQVVSDVPGLSATLTHPNELNTALGSVGFWQGSIRVKSSYKKIAHLSIPTIISPQSLVVHLTDKEQPLEQTAGRGKDGQLHPYQGFGIQYEAQVRKLDLYLFVLPSLVAQENSIAWRLKRRLRLRSPPSRTTNPTVVLDTGTILGLGSPRRRTS